MEQEHLHDPLRFQYGVSTRIFSLRTKIIAIVLVLIFISVPLYEISPDAFMANYMYEYVPCPIYVNCGCFF
ncbi:hypothetical protein [Kordia jejudonensis]|uniref:hypothetical protein n=1 Tax=Kordia jejudonensis TaxID=1348245 RepID=UPI0012E0C409|nr:hypothetical protein [Kordia jejudonensis]